MQVYWSLGVKDYFYLLFPLIYMLTRRRSVNSVALGLITFPIILLIGKALQVGIEAPMLRLKKKYIRVHTPSRETALAS